MPVARRTTSHIACKTFYEENRVLCLSLHTDSNSVFYFNCGGKGSFGQWAVFAATGAMFFAGPSLVTYIPRWVNWVPGVNACGGYLC